MPKNNRSGQSSILDDANYISITNQFIDRKHKLIFDIAWWTGERLGAICRLPTNAVYDVRGQPLTHITFPARTRKAAPDGSRKTRQVPMHKNLRAILRDYWKTEKPDFTGNLFPGKDGHQPIQFQSADDALRRAIAKAGLEAAGISTHSFRRTFITKLAEKGVAIAKIQKLTGHSDLKTLSRYIEVSDDELTKVISIL